MVIIHSAICGPYLLEQVATSHSWPGYIASLQEGAKDLYSSCWTLVLAPIQSTFEHLWDGLSICQYKWTIIIIIDIIIIIINIIYILTAENLGVCFSFFLENYLMDFSQTLPFSSLYCSQGYKQKSEMCCYFCLATKCEIFQNLPVLAPIYGHF